MHRAIRLMARQGIRQIVVVVGYKADLVRRETGARFEGAEITYVDSPEYARTGTAVSLLRAVPFMTEDALVLEADVLFDEVVLRRVLDGGAPENVAAIAAFVPPLSGTVVTLTAGNRIASFTRGVRAGEMPHSFKTVNLYRFSHEFITEHLTGALTAAVSGTPQAYVEDVLGKLVSEDHVLLTGIDCSDCTWFEVDDQADLEHARRLFRHELA